MPRFLGTALSPEFNRRALPRASAPSPGTNVSRPRRRRSISRCWGDLPTSRSQFRHASPLYLLRSFSSSKGFARGGVRWECFYLPREACSGLFLRKSENENVRRHMKIWQNGKAPRPLFIPHPICVLKSQQHRHCSRASTMNAPCGESVRGILTKMEARPRQPLLTFGTEGSQK